MLLGSGKDCQRHGRYRQVDHRVLCDGCPLANAVLDAAKEPLYIWGNLYVVIQVVDQCPSVQVRLQDWQETRSWPPRSLHLAASILVFEMDGEVFIRGTWSDTNSTRLDTSLARWKPPVTLPWSTGVVRAERNESYLDPTYLAGTTAYVRERILFRR